jgi:hypothetical protein
MKLYFNPQQLLRFFFLQRVNRDAGPTRNHIFNIVTRHLSRNKRIFVLQLQVGSIAIRPRPFIQFFPISQVALLASYA